MEEVRNNASNHRERIANEDLRSKDAVETAIDRSKDASRTWESALPAAAMNKWTKRNSATSLD
jgi:hypothetical protein